MASARAVELSTQAATVSVLSRVQSSAKGALERMRYSGASDMGWLAVLREDVAFD